MPEDSKLYTKTTDQSQRVSQQRQSKESYNKSNRKKGAKGKNSKRHEHVFLDDMPN